MAGSKGSKSTKAQKPAEMQGNVHVDGNVINSNIIVGSNNTIIIDGKQVQFRTGWFYGHRYGDLDTFTGRAAEMDMLNGWLNNDKDNLLVLRALGGFGKSALAWTWFNRVDREQWQTAIWWSFYEKESGFESFLAETLKHLGVEVKASARMQLNDLLEAMRGTNILIVLDGFERLLRQYGRMDAALQSDDEDAGIDPSQRDCSSPLTETFLRGLSGAGMKSKVLMTTRLCPRAVESADGKLLKGCREEPLSAFSPEDAVTYFQNEGIKATRAEVIEVCSAYGYHPLSLSLLVGLINEDHEQRGDIVAVKNLEIFEDVRARRHHVLERAYGSLAPERRDLLSKMSCFRGSMEYAVLKKVFPSPDLDKALLDLRKRGLILETRGLENSEVENGELEASQPTSHPVSNHLTSVFDMHPIVRHYAYDRFTDLERKETHKNLAYHFIDVMVDVMPTPNTKVKTLEDLAPVIELYHHMVVAGNLDEAIKLFHDRLVQQVYFQFGAYQLIIELLRALFLDGEDKPPRLKDESAQTWTLDLIASNYALSGQPRRAVPLFLQGNELDEKNGNKKGVAIGLGNVAQRQLVIGALSAAERNLRQSIDLCHEIADEQHKSVGHLELGHVLFYRGEWQEAEQELSIAEKVIDKYGAGQTNYVSVVRAYRALRFLLMVRGQKVFNQLPVDNVKSAFESAKYALELADEHSKKRASYPLDFMRAHWLLGAAYRSSASLRSAQNEANNELTLAEENLFKALDLCRQINLVDHEADILLELARLRYKQGDFKDALAKAAEALSITERSGYVLQGADVHLFLAELAMKGFKFHVPSSMSDKEAARFHAEEAKRLAYCDGGEYKYKVAYDEAVAMLEKLK
jgi:tetratricopeptide (TPR) repeat protein